MAVDVCSEIPSLVVSPRISFSHDLNQEDVAEVEFHHRRSDALLLESTIDFDFCISNSFIQELSSADELFSNGKILPAEIKNVEIARASIEQTHRPEPILIPPKLSTRTPKNPSPPSENANEDTKKKRLKEFLSSNIDAEEEEKPPSKPFWQFQRSSSLDCDNGRSKGLIRSLQFLSRSNSTGSAPNSKQPTTVPKVNQKPNLQKQSLGASTKSSVPSFDVPFLTYASKKPQQKKDFRSYSNGVSISPVLNIPPTYISKGTVSLFGFGSFFCNAKSKKKKK